MPRWTEQTKQKQRDRILHQRPWLESTGPRSDYGRLVSSRNATKKHRRRQSEPHPNQQSDIDRPLEIGDRVKYTGGFPPTMLACGDSPLEVLGFCQLGTGALLCRSARGQLIWVYSKDLQRCLDGRMKPEGGNQS